MTEPRRDRPHIILQLDAGELAVGVWVRDEEGEPIYEIRNRSIRDASIAATLAARERGAGKKTKASRR